MWSILIGIGLGAFEIYVLKKLISMLTAGTGGAGAAVPIVIAKLALILIVLWLFAEFVSLSAMVWCAAGVAAAMIGIPVILSIRTIKKYKRGGGERK